jgi:hypothetical protein
MKRIPLIKSKELSTKSEEQIQPSVRVMQLEKIQDLVINLSTL